MADYHSLKGCFLSDKGDFPYLFFVRNPDNKEIRTFVSHQPEFKEENLISVDIPKEGLQGTNPPAVYFLTENKKECIRVLLHTIPPPEPNTPQEESTYQLRPQGINLNFDQCSFYALQKTPQWVGTEHNLLIDQLKQLLQTETERKTIQSLYETVLKELSTEFPPDTVSSPQVEPAAAYEGSLDRAACNQLTGILGTSGYLNLSTDTSSREKELRVLLLRAALMGDLKKALGNQSITKDEEIQLLADLRIFRATYLYGDSIAEMSLRENTPSATDQRYDYITFLIQSEINRLDPTQSISKDQIVKMPNHAAKHVSNHEISYPENHLSDSMNNALHILDKAWVERRSVQITAASEAERTDLEKLIFHILCIVAHEESPLPPQEQSPLNAAVNFFLAIIQNEHIAGLQAYGFMCHMIARSKPGSLANNYSVLKQLSLQECKILAQRVSMAVEWFTVPESYFQKEIYENFDHFIKILAHCTREQQSKLLRAIPSFQIYSSEQRKQLSSMLQISCEFYPELFGSVITKINVYDNYQTFSEAKNRQEQQTVLEKIPIENSDQLNDFLCNALTLQPPLTKEHFELFFKIKNPHRLIDNVKTLFKIIEYCGKLKNSNFVLMLVEGLSTDQKAQLISDFESLNMITTQLQSAFQLDSFASSPSQSPDSDVYIQILNTLLHEKWSDGIQSWQDLENITILIPSSPKILPSCITQETLDSIAERLFNKMLTGTHPISYLELWCSINYLTEHPLPLKNVEWTTTQCDYLRDFINRASFTRFEIDNFATLMPALFQKNSTLASIVYDTIRINQKQKTWELLIDTEQDLAWDVRDLHYLLNRIPPEFNFNQIQWERFCNNLSTCIKQDSACNNFFKEKFIQFVLRGKTNQQRAHLICATHSSSAHLLSTLQATYTYYLLPACIQDTQFPWHDFNQTALEMMLRTNLLSTSATPLLYKTELLKSILGCPAACLHIQRGFQSTELTQQGQQLMMELLSYGFLTQSFQTVPGQAFLKNLLNDTQTRKNICTWLEETPNDSTSQHLYDGMQGWFESAAATEQGLQLMTELLNSKLLKTDQGQTLFKKLLAHPQARHNIYTCLEQTPNDSASQHLYDGMQDWFKSAAATEQGLQLMTELLNSKLFQTDQGQTLFKTLLAHTQAKHNIYTCLEQISNDNDSASKHLYDGMQGWFESAAATAQDLQLMTELLNSKLFQTDQGQTLFKKLLAHTQARHNICTCLEQTPNDSASQHLYDGMQGWFETEQDVQPMTELLNSKLFQTDQGQTLFKKLLAHTQARHNICTCLEQTPNDSASQHLYDGMQGWFETEQDVQPMTELLNSLFVSATIFL